MKMKKKLYHWLVAMLLMVPAVVSAREMKFVVDSIEVDTVEVDYVVDGDDVVRADSTKITQYALCNCDGVAVCENLKYAIVTKDGKKGIYDMMLGKNVTEIEFQEITFLCSEDMDDGSSSSWFLVKRENQTGIFCVFEDDNSVMAIWGGITQMRNLRMNNVNEISNIISIERYEKVIMDVDYGRGMCLLPKTKYKE